MPRQDSNFYAQWRLRRGPAALRESAEPPPERLLQAVWQHQRLKREQLRTLDGATVRVLHPGFAAAGSGPDFHDAVLQFGSAPPQTGAVEVDLKSCGWHAHGHDSNPAFQNVALHVIWQPERNAKFPGHTLALEPVLDAPIAELNQWLDREPVKALPSGLQGKCSAPLRELTESEIEHLLQEAARVRFEGKAAQLQARARQVGWEQALWEGLFRAAGYQHNTWPMQCLAESRAQWAGRDNSPVRLQARLLGLSGLLPTELSRRETAADGYLRQVWDCWWRERDELSEALLPRELWRLHGLRPANHPQRRLALAAHWIATGDLPARIERWCQSTPGPEHCAGSLLKILQVNEDEYWSWHWTFRSARLSKPQPLLGATRLTDLAINVVLPWLWTRAVEGGNESLRAEIERRYFAWPAAEDNSVLRLARQRLLNSASRKLFRHAAAQQGLIQIVRDFCDHSNAICENCGFPDLVRGMCAAPNRAAPIE